MPPLSPPHPRSRPSRTPDPRGHHDAADAADGPHYMPTLHLPSIYPASTLHPDVRPPTTRRIPCTHPVPPRHELHPALHHPPVHHLYFGNPHNPRRAAGPPHCPPCNAPPTPQGGRCVWQCWRDVLRECGWKKKVGRKGGKKNPPLVFALSQRPHASPRYPAPPVGAPDPRAPVSPPDPGQPATRH